MFEGTFGEGAHTWGGKGPRLGKGEGVWALEGYVWEGKRVRLDNFAFLNAVISRVFSVTS